MKKNNYKKLIESSAGNCSFSYMEHRGIFKEKTRKNTEQNWVNTEKKKEGNTKAVIIHVRKVDNNCMLFALYW